MQINSQRVLKYAYTENQPIYIELSNYFSNIFILIYEYTCEKPKHTKKHATRNQLN